LLALSCLGVSFAIDKTRGLTRSLTLAQVIVLSIMIYSVVKEKEDRILLAKMYFVACGIVSLLQLFKYFDIAALSFLNVEIEKGRAMGFAGDPNRFGMILLPAVYLGMASIVMSRSRLWKAIAVAGILIIIFGIALTISRAIILSFIFSFLIFTAWQFYERGQTRFSIFVVLCVITIAFLLVSNAEAPHFMAMRQYMQRRFSYLTINNLRNMDNPMGSVSFRPAMIKIGLEMILYHPLGVGPGNFSVGSLQMGHLEMDAHNSVIEVAGELGFQGLACFLIMILLAIKPIFSKAHSMADSFEKIILFSFMSFFLASLSLTAVANKAFWFLIGLSAASGESLKKYEKDCANVSQLSE